MDVLRLLVFGQLAEVVHQWNERSPGVHTEK